MMNDLGFYAMHLKEIWDGVTLCNLTVQSTLSSQVIEAQQHNEEAEGLRAKFLSGNAQERWMIHANQGLHYQGKLFIPVSCREEILREFHHSPLAIHPRGTKIYHNLHRQFWWSGIKRDVVIVVSKCLTCQKVKAEHQRPTRELQPY
ncbi:uncharacterized protein LOC131302936 [Rhododendron vialii]|uniref:uncharacterized protein LOC131302936 n=1 Tax=Rhododendron vialii TaxID=182163 RepID=UPI00266051FA|nr:uncharacterized protein LOC131302936 [Rhododendron vialii]